MWFMLFRDSGGCGSLRLFAMTELLAHKEGCISRGQTIRRTSLGSQ